MVPWNKDGLELDIDVTSAPLYSVRILPPKAARAFVGKACKKVTCPKQWSAVSAGCPKPRQLSREKPINIDSIPSFKTV